MKILHCCLSSIYVDGYGYQENILPRYNKADGHEVKILASTEVYINNQKLGYVAPGSHVDDAGIEITRLPYRRFLPHKIMRKLRYYQGVTKFLEQFQPDVILYHGISGHGMVEVADYCSTHPSTKLYIDSHASFANSGRNFLSKNIQHKILGRCWMGKALPLAEMILPISLECYPFLRELYKIPDANMELFPLGGEILSSEEHQSLRKSLRQELGFSDDDIVLIHTGKMNSNKNTSILLDALLRTKETSAIKLIMVGSACDEVKAKIDDAAQRDSRIRYLGWLSGDRLRQLFHAADIYMQPGSASASFQQALCAGCAGAARSAHSYPEFFGNAFWPIDSTEDIVKLLQSIAANPELLVYKKRESFAFAKENLDYAILASRIYR